VFIPSGQSPRSNISLKNGERGRGGRGRPLARACGRGGRSHREVEQELMTSSSPPVGIPEESPRARLRPRTVINYNYMLGLDFDSD
jgi:hypothetical protein